MLPENPNSGDSDDDEEEESDGSEEEDGDPLADLPDETEVHIVPASTLRISDRYAIRNSIWCTRASFRLRGLGFLGSQHICKGYVSGKISSQPWIRKYFPI